MFQGLTVQCIYIPASVVICPLWIIHIFTQFDVATRVVVIEHIACQSMRLSFACLESEVFASAKMVT